MKKYLFVSLLILSAHIQAVQVWDGKSSSWTNGNGTSANPYLLESPQHLSQLSKNVANGTNYAGVYFRQTDDFDMNASNSYVITPIGKDNTHPFKGNFDGQGHIISNVSINAMSNKSYIGLFGYVESSRIENLHVDGFSIYGGGSSILFYTSPMVAYVKGGVLSNCSSNANLSVSSVCHGGMAGCAEGDVTIAGCVTEGTVTINVNDSNICVGGLVGFKKAGGVLSINASHNNAGINMTFTSAAGNKEDMVNVGGIVGEAALGLQLYQTYNTGAIVADVKHNHTGSYTYNTTRVYYSGTTPLYRTSRGSSIRQTGSGVVVVSHTNYYSSILNVGGVVGYINNEGGSSMNMSLTECCNTGNLTVTSTGTVQYVETNTAGILGRSDAENTTDNKILSSYARCNISVPGTSSGNAPKRSSYDGGNSQTDTDEEISSSNVGRHRVSGGGRLPSIPQFGGGHISVGTGGYTSGSTSGSTTTVVPDTNHYAAGLMADKHAQFNISINNCYYAGTISGQKIDGISTETVNTFSNNYYLASCGVNAESTYGGAIEEEDMKSNAMPIVLNNDGDDIFVSDEENRNAGFPLFAYQLPATYTLKLNTDNTKGTVSGEGSYVEGSQVTISATAKEGWRFVRWSDNITTNPRTITLTQDTSLIAEFEVLLTQYTLTLSVNDSDMGMVLGAAGTYNDGAEVTITAMPNDLYMFRRWSDGVTDNPRILNIDNDITLIAIFTPVGSSASEHSSGIGMFSVSASKKVTFSAGNVQYRASTGTWRFAEHQWDFVGNATEGTVYQDNVKSINSNVGSAYDGWIDTYGWGTGDAPTKVRSNYKDYLSFTDWGTNAISNGGNTAGMWYTLSKDELAYLLHGRNNYENLFGLGTVAGVNGIILLPDNWSKPQGLSFIPSVANGLSWSESYYTQNGINHYADNTYTVTQWERMEAAGAVFLPAAGIRNGYAGVSGSYWTSTQDGTTTAQGLYFDASVVNFQRGLYSLYYGFSVRLVRSLPNNPKFTITFVNYDGTMLQSSQVGYGVVPSYNGSTPAKPSDKQYKYTFAGWNKDLVSVTSDATYIATYNRTKNKYTVVFYDADGVTMLGKQEVEYGSAAIAPEVDVPECRSLAWDKDFSNVTEDLIVKVVWQNIPLASGTCGAQGDNLTWELSCDSVLTISGTGVMVDWGSESQAPWYPYMNQIKSVVITDGVTNISGNAFCSYYNNLISVTIGNSVSDIGEYNPFAYCRNISSIVVASDNTTFDSRNSCNAIIEKSTNTLKVGCTNTIIPNNVISIGVAAFCGCEGLTNIEIPTSVTSISGWAFYRCKGLTRVEIPHSVTTIGDRAFQECYGSLTSVTIGDGVTSIGNNAFEVCTDIISISIGSKVTSIGSAAFISCKSLTTISINAVKPPTCGSLTFSYVDKSIPLYVPAESIEAYRAADGWKDFTNIQPICPIASGTCGAEGDNLTWELSCDSVLTISGTGDMAGYANMDQSWRDYTKSFKSVVIGDGVTSIGDSAFHRCSNLTSVTIPSGVTSIGRLALYDCPKLTSVTIPNTVTSIGYGTFVGCIGLTAMSVDAGNPVFDSRNNCNAIIETATNRLIVGCQNTVVPGSVTSIGDGAFRGCTTLTSINIPNGVTSIEPCAFWHCGLTSIDFPSSLTSIGRQAFVNCYELASVDIPNSVTSIGNGAFINCRSLTSIDIPNSITSIGDSTFYHCTGLTAVTIPSGVTSIGLRAFYQCSGMTSLTLSNSVTSMGVGAFCGCYSLTSMTVDAGNTVYDSRDNCNAIIETATNTLVAGCQNTVIPNSVTSIGNFAFRECNTLTSIDIPGSVTSIGNGAFYGCTGLTTVTIPSGVASIAGWAFYDCRGLTSISCAATNAPELGSNMFNYVNKSIPLLVPAESIESYRAADQWKDFTNILPICPSSGTCGAQGDNLTWELSCDSVLTISGTGAIANFANIDPLWRAYRGNFKSVIIGDGVTGIGDSAFYNCSHLTSVTIPSGVTSIGARAFYKCHNLTSVTIPSSVTSIGIGAFCDGSGLTSMSVEAGNTVYDSRDNCNAIIETATNMLIVGCQNTVIPSSVTGIGDNAFRECSSLTSIDIPNSVTSIGNYAFRACAGLTSVIIPYGVTSIGNGAFSSCNGLTSVALPNSVTSIGDGAFYYCSGLTSVTIPSSVTGIGEYALGGCIGLTSITCKATNVPELGDNVFYLVDKSIPLHVPAESVDAYKAADQWKDFTNIISTCLIASGTCGAQGDNLTWELSCDSVLTISGTGDMAGYANMDQSWRDYMKRIRSVMIGDGVTSIGDSTFYNCSSLNSVTIPSCITSIGRMAFYNCRSLTSVTIPNSVTSIGNGAFGGCIGMTAMTVDAGNTIYDSRENCNAIIETATNTLVVGCQNTIIPSSVTSIWKHAFRECSSLISIDIPSSVTSIGKGAFYTCIGLTSVTIPGSVTCIEQHAFAKCNKLKSVTILNGVASIGQYVFASCTALTSIDIPNSVTSIGVAAFAGCNSLTSVEIPNNITSIGDSTFYSCSSLKSITIPSSVTSIGRMAFYNCSSMTSVNIPSSVTIIGPYAFSSCSSLTSISVEAGNTAYDSRENCNAIIETATNTLIAGCQNTVIPNSVTSIWKNAFRACSGLTSVTIPNKVTSIGRGAFYNCIDLTSVVIGNSVTGIGVGAFMECRGLTSLTISGSVTSIADSAFLRCRSLTSITCKAENTPELGRNVFYNVDKSIPLHVPAESVDAYKAADGWKDFTNILPTCILASGTCGAQGDNLTWELSCDSVLTISGTGAMISLESSNLPDTWKQYKNQIKEVVINEGATNISIYAFSQCSVLVAVTIPSSVLTIDNKAFENCVSLASVNMPDNLKSIGRAAFYNCKNLTSITLYEGLESIDAYAFDQCDNLQSIHIPASVTSIGESAYLGCCSVETISVAPGNMVYDSRENCNAIIETSTNRLIAGCRNTIIPNSVLRIGASAFHAQYYLESIEIPNSVKCIEYSGFAYCNSLDSVIIPNSIDTIANSAFYGCQRLKSVYIPSNVKYVGTSAFNNCIRVESIVVAKDNAEYDSRENSNAIIRTSTKTLVTGCKNTVIPEGVVKIGSSAFSCCPYMTQMNLPHSLTSIGGHAFQSSAIRKITIPENVTTIDAMAFYDCYNLYTVEFKGMIPPAIDNYAGGAFGKSPCTFYVPCGTKDAYVEALGVEASKVVEKVILTYSVTSFNEGQGSVAITHDPVCDDLTLSFTATPAQGYDFLQWSDGNTDNPRSLTLVQDTVITAQWVKTFIITWKDADGTTFATDIVRQGATPVAPADPTKAATAQYTYTFAGWTPDIVAATADATYTATYSATLNECTISGEQNISDLAVGENTHIIVAGDGHLVVDVPATIGCLTLTMNGTTAAQVTGIEDLTASTIDAIFTVRARQWFALGVPFDVNVATGIRINGANVAANYGTDYVMDEYDGALRASTQDGWKRVASSATLHPGKLYMIYTAGATAWRLTAANPAVIAEAESVAVAANQSSFGDHHAGWNGIAIPRWTNASASLNGVNYATLYNNQHSVYAVVPMAEKTFIPAEPFFVQTPDAGSVLFADDAAPAPWRVTAATEMPTMTVALTNEAQTFTDKAYISMAQDKPNTYLIGHDLEKMQVAAPAVPQLWLEAYDMHLAAYETSLMSDNQIIPLGLYAPAEGDYTIAIDNVPAQFVITLMRNDQPVWNLSESACIASLQAGNNADYALRISQKSDVVTDLNTLNGGSAEVRKMIIDDQLYILRDGKTYTGQGWEVK